MDEKSGEYVSKGVIEKFYRMGWMDGCESIRDSISTLIEKLNLEKKEVPDETKTNSVCGEEMQKNGYPVDCA